MSGVRLVPDIGADNPYQLRNAEAGNKPPALLSDAATSGAIAAPPSAFASNAAGLAASPYPVTPQSLNHSNDPYAMKSAGSANVTNSIDCEPRAKLRLEAPRPFDFEARPPVVAYAPPLLNSANQEAAEARSASANFQASGLTPAGYVEQAQPTQTTNVVTIGASYVPAAESANVGLSVSPPPWPEATDEETAARTHIVVDGDSLEKLAGRYLDDPQRGNEIFEANRELLSSPDLLPIGAELVIPTRRTSLSPDGTPRSSMWGNDRVRAASNDGLVPVRPVIPATGPIPRAQLLRPISAE